jgi:hypothetical protein
MCWGNCRIRTQAHCIAVPCANHRATSKVVLCNIVPGTHSICCLSSTKTWDGSTFKFCPLTCFAMICCGLITLSSRTVILLEECLEQILIKTLARVLWLKSFSCFFYLCCRNPLSASHFPHKIKLMQFFNSRKSGALGHCNWILHFSYLQYVHYIIVKVLGRNQNGQHYFDGDSFSPIRSDVKQITLYSYVTFQFLKSSLFHTSNKLILMKAKNKL